MLNLQKVVHNRYKIERTDWWVGMYFLAIMLWCFEKHLMTDLYKKKKKEAINSFDNKYSA